MACWQFIGDIDGYVRHGALVVEGAIVEVAEAGVLITVGVGDVVLKAKEEMSEGFSRCEVKLVNVKQGAGHTFRPLEVLYASFLFGTLWQCLCMTRLLCSLRSFWGW